eukprot:4399469-Pleurochrysis_carterae.AAC.5
MFAIVALVAVDAAFASAVSRRSSSSLPLPLHAVVHDRRAAWQEIVCRISVIILWSVASTNSGATMQCLASSADNGGRPDGETEGTGEAQAAVGDSWCGRRMCLRRVCLDVACRLGSDVVPCGANAGLCGKELSKR